MKLNSKIYIAGHRGMVGSAIWRNLKSKGYTNLIGKTSSELNLVNQEEVKQFFEKEKPDYVILAAAKVGGIIANNTYRAQFIYENTQIQNNVIHYSYVHKVKKLLFLGSSCIYPKNAPQPLKEESLLTSELEYTNEPYAIAKIAGIKMCEAYNIQYGTNFISVMPTNLYGFNDNYDLEKSHVLPALIRKMHLGKCLMNNNWESIRQDIKKNPIEKVTEKATNSEIIEILNKYGIKCQMMEDTNKIKMVTIMLWGTGKPRREFLHADDMASSCVHIIENIDFKELKKSNDEIKNTHINIGCGEDQSIEELAHIIKKNVGFKGKITWDATKPDGTFQKLMDVSKLKALKWSPEINLEEGLEGVYHNYLQYDS